METFSALLAICVGNSPVPGEFPAQRPVTQSFDVFFDLCLNKRLSKQSWDWWFETLSRPLWRHRNECIHTYGDAPHRYDMSIVLIASFLFPSRNIRHANHRDMVWSLQVKISHTHIQIRSFLLPPPWRRLCFHRCPLLVCSSVCLLATLRKNGWTDFHEIFRVCGTWYKEQFGTFSRCSI